MSFFTWALILFAGARRRTAQSRLCALLTINNACARPAARSLACVTGGGGGGGDANERNTMLMIFPRRQN